MKLRAAKEIYSDPVEIKRLESYGFYFDDGFILGEPEISLSEGVINGLIRNFGKVEVSSDEILILNYQ